MLDARSFQHRFGALLRDDAPGEHPALRRALAVHRNTAHKAAQDALAANYPVAAALVGDDAFAACAAEFVRRSPPDDPRLCVYGAGFSDHLAAWPSFSELSYLAEVAALEWLVVQALFAADAPVVDAAHLASAVDPAAPLRLHPATHLARFGVPAASIWQAHQPETPSMLETLRWQPEIVLVTRPDLSVQVTIIDEPTCAFLAAATLGQAAAACYRHGGDVATVFATLLTAGALA